MPHSTLDPEEREWTVFEHRTPTGDGFRVVVRGVIDADMVEAFKAFASVQVVLYDQQARKKPGRPGPKPGAKPAPKPDAPKPEGPA